MPLRRLDEGLSLDTIEEEIVYTTARLRADDNAADAAPELDKLAAQVETVRKAQHAAWNAETAAQAAIDSADDALDDAVGQLSRDLLYAVGNDRRSPRFTRYFAEAPGHLLRLGLRSELERVKNWPQSLAGEKDAKLEADGKALAALVQRGEQALAARKTAAGARADQRVREVLPLVDDVNAARLSLYGLLAQRAAARDLPRDWPDRFFRHGHLHHHANPPPAGGSPPAAG